MYESTDDVDPHPSCLMHSHDPKKDLAQFAEVIRAIRVGTCPYHRSRKQFDFSAFVFPEALFSQSSSMTRSGLTRIATYVDVAEEQAFHAQMGMYGWRERVQSDAVDEVVPSATPARDNLDPSADVVFTRDVDFTRAVFLGRAWFVDTTFMGTALFADASFSSQAIFRHAIFRKDVDFKGATFADEIDFYNAWFYAPVRFSGADIKRGARFSQTLFDSHANFNEAHFKGWADFSKAAFNRQSEFQNTAFDNGVDFTRTLFRQRANFPRISFGGTVVFDQTIFSNAFLKKLPDQQNLVSERPTAPVVADFSGATFGDPQHTHLIRVNQRNPTDRVSGARPEGFQCAR